MAVGEPARVPWKPAPGPFSRADLLAMAVWTGAVVLAFGQAALLREALFYFDVTEINFPYRAFLAGEYRAGRLSRWCPSLHCGLPLFSESQAGYFHPLKLLYLLLPTWQAFNLDTVLSVWLAGAAAYGWLRRHVGPTAALGGAATFGLGGFMWSHVIHTSMVNALPSVPLAVWALECAWAGGRLRPLAPGAGAIACQVFAGHLQDTILTSLVVGLYGLYRATIERGRGRGFALGSAVGMVLLAGLLSAVQWVPSKELLDRSPRSGGLSWGDLTYGSWSPELLPTLVVREAYGTRSHDTDWMDGFYPYQEMDAYLGLLGLGLAAIGAGAYRDRWVGFWLALVGIGAVLMLGRYTVLFDAMHRIPIVGSARIPVRYHLWVSLGVAALVAVGIDRIARPGAVPLRGAVLVIVALVLASLPILYRAYEPVWTQPERWTTPYHRARYGWLGDELAWATIRTGGLTLLGLWAAAQAVRSGDSGRRAGAAALLPVIILADLLGAHWNEVPTVSPRYWTVPPRSAQYLKEQPDVGRIYGLGAYSAGEPGYAVKPVDLFAARDTLAWSLAPVWGLRSSGSITPIFDRRLLLYELAAVAGRTRFDFESVTHLLAGDAGSDFERFGKPLRRGAAYIYRNRGALPRARIAGRPIYVKDAVEAARVLRARRREVLDHLIVEDPTRPLGERVEATGTARIVVDEPERVEVEAASAGPAYLVLADTFDPGWHAFLDGREVPIRPAYAAFRAVYLAGGTHKIVFTYEPAGFRAGLIVSGIGALLAAGMLARRRPVARLEDEHGEASWPLRWPVWGLLAALAFVGVSVIGVREGGRPGVQRRWTGSFHRFTWGAKIEGMKPPPDPGF